MGEKEKKAESHPSRILIKCSTRGSGVGKRQWQRAGATKWLLNLIQYCSIYSSHGWLHEYMNVCTTVCKVCSHAYWYTVTEFSTYDIHLPLGTLGISFIQSYFFNVAVHVRVFSVCFVCVFAEHRKVGARESGCISMITRTVTNGGCRREDMWLSQ